jgi:hypothetical protein
MPIKKQTRRPFVPKHVRATPDGQEPREFEWYPVTIARNELKNYKAAQLAKMWARWFAQRESVHKDWIAAQNERVAAIALEIDSARQDQLLRDEETKRREFIEADHRENQKYLDAVQAAVAKAHRRECKKLRAGIQRDGMKVARAKLKMLGKRVR